MGVHVEVGFENRLQRPADRLLGEWGGTWGHDTFPALLKWPVWANLRLACRVVLFSLQHESCGTACRSGVSPCVEKA